ncbi:unnamed protein product [Caenorhabditis brenneri]
MDNYSHSLLDMPELVMKNILEFSGYRSILVLRKVCRDLRNYIDDVGHEISLHSLEISIGFTKQGAQEIVLAVISSGENHIIHFRTHPKGCQVIYRKKKRTIEKMDYQSVFFEELDCILKRQKPFLGIFRISLSTVSSQFCDALRSKIVAKGQLEVQNVSIKAEKQQVLHFLRCISPKYLKRIELYLTRPVVLDVMEFANLDLWNLVEEVFTEGLTFLGPVECFGRFSKAEVTVFRMSVEGLFYLKEKFLTSPNFKQFIIHYRHYADEEASDLRLRIVETNQKTFRIFWTFIP